MKATPSRKDKKHTKRTAVVKASGLVSGTRADTLADGWRFWVDWLRLVAPDNATEIGALEADAGRHLGYVRVVGRRRAEAPLYEPVVSIPAQYTRKPLLRGSG
jgi:hypothetical protein